MIRSGIVYAGLFGSLLMAAGVADQQDASPAAAGAALFQRSCASCHNVEGRAPSLSTGVFAHGGADAQLAETIRAGVPGTQMPAFPQLSPDAIADLIAYIRSRGRDAAPPVARVAAVAASDGAGLTYERLRNSAAEPHNWLTYWGDYQGTHYS